MDIIPGPQWQRLWRNLSDEKGTVMIVGSTDSGKSTLARYLTSRFLSSAARKVSLLDADVGQSSLGLPGTLSMKVFQGEEDLRDFTFGRMSFIGTTSPVRNMQSLINGTKRMASLCRRSSEVTIIDTDGLISGGIGKALKMAQIRAVSPDNIVAIQQSDEVEHILSPLKEIPVHRLEVSPGVKVRSRTARTSYRREKLLRYFGERKLNYFSAGAEKVEFFRPGEACDWKSFALEGAVIGLNRGNETIGLGILTAASDSIVNFRSPVRGISRVDKIILGEITIDQITGTER